MKAKDRYHLVEVRLASLPEVKSLARTYFSGLQKDKLDVAAFYDGSVQDPEDFVTLACCDELLLYLIVDATKDYKPCAHFHLMGFMGRTATVHFSIRRMYHGKQGFSLVRCILNKIFKLKRLDGTLLVTSLTGLTPVSNELACKFIQRLGFIKQFILKESCDFANGVFQDGMVTLREEI